MADVNKIGLWAKNLSADALADNYTLFRNHMKRLDVPKPKQAKLMVEGTILMMHAISYFSNIDNNVDHQPLRRFIKMQKYDPSKAPDARYVFTFNLNGNVYARMLVDSTLVIPDLADLYGYPFHGLKTVGYGCLFISHPDWSPLMKKELKELKREVTDDLRYDYPEENDLHFFFDTGPDDTYLILGFYEVGDGMKYITSQKTKYNYYFP